MELHEILERNKELFPVFQECIETITKHVDRIKELEELLYELYTEQRAYDERVAIAMDTCFAVDRAQGKVAHYLRNDALFSKLKRPESVSDD